MTKVHATAIVAPGAKLAEDVDIGPYCIVGAHVTLGPGVCLRSHAVVEGHTEIGEGCEVYPFAVLGTAPQHTAYKGEPTRLMIGARNLIREQVTMHTGSTVGRGVTTVGSDCLFYAGAHVGHDCVVGDKVVMANAATLGGHATVADFANLGGLCAIAQHRRVGRHAFIGGMAGVNHDVIPFGSVWGNHAHMEGLNLVGLKRRGFSRDQINSLRAAYRRLFAEEGVFQDRVDDVARAFADCAEVMEIIDFIRAEEGRPITMPARGL